LDYDLAAVSAKKPKKSNKRKDKATLASVIKEMARPRFAESCRQEEEEATYRTAKHDNFLNS